MSIPASRPLLSALGVSRSSMRAAAGSARSLHRGIRPSSIAGPSRLPLVLPTRYRAASTAVHLPPRSSSSLADSLLGGESTPIKVTPPSLDAIKEDGFFDDDVALISPGEAKIVITPAAITQLASITSREPPETIAAGKLALRVGVESGGCHGYQYTMVLTEERGVDDYVFQPEGAQSIPVIIDLVSLGLLKGATLHHATELIGSSFRIENNPQAKQGGACGCGVSWEANDQSPHP